MRKYSITIAIIFLLVIIFSGCTKPIIPTNNSSSPLPIKNTNESSSETTKINETNKQNQEYIFNELDFIYTMTSIYSFCESDYRGEIDLNEDGINEIIEFNFNYDSSEPHHILKINNLKKDFVFYHNVDIYTIDLDSNDHYKEIVIVENGMDSYSSFGIYRYTGDDIVELGVIKDTYYLGSILFDSNGRFIPYINRIEGIIPLIISGYYEVIGNELVFKNMDVNTFINNEYVFNSDTQIYFEKSEQLPTDSSAYEGDLKEIRVNKGEKIFINKISVSPDASYTKGRLTWINVILDNGTKGNIYLNDSVYY